MSLVPESALAIILAGGQGTRLRHLHPHLPKPMIPCLGRPFVEWVIRSLHTLGLRRFCLSLGHLAEVAEAYVHSRPQDGLALRTVREAGPSGTGGGLRGAWQTEPEALVVAANGDSLVLGDLSPAWSLLDPDEVDGVLVGLPCEDTSRYGRFRLGERQRLEAFEEKRPGAGLINAGIYFLKPHLFGHLPEKTPLSLENEVFPGWLDLGFHLRVYPCAAPFLDIGTPESLALAEHFLTAHRDAGFSGG